eukprot:548448_1
MSAEENKQNLNRDQQQQQQPTLQQLQCLLSQIQQNCVQLQVHYTQQTQIVRQNFQPFVVNVTTQLKKAIKSNDTDKIQQLQVQQQNIQQEFEQQIRMLQQQYTIQTQQLQANQLSVKTAIQQILQLDQLSLNKNTEHVYSKWSNLQSQMQIFSVNANKCFRRNKNKNAVVIEDCSALHRLICALKYYSTVNNEDFTAFCSNVYKTALDDHIHFMTYHSKQIEQINQLIKNPDDGCLIDKCNVLKRHYDSERNNRIQETVNSFYCDLFDQFHHFLYHLFDIGIRIKRADINISEFQNQQTDKKQKYIAIDYVFAQKQNIIQQKRDKSKINRFTDDKN